MSGKSIITNSYLEDIGDAIRYKKGSEDRYYPSQMGDAIRSIEGIVPAGTLDIDANGTYDVTEYAETVVDVPDPVVTSLTVTEDGTYEVPSGVDGYNPVTVNTGIDALRSEIDSAVEVSGCDPLVEGLTALTRYANEVTEASDVTLSDAVGTLVAGYSGSSEEELLLKVLDRTISGDVTINSIEKLGYQAFSQCTGLIKISLPNCIEFNSGYVFNGCNNIEEYYLPKLRDIYSQQIFVNPKVKCIVLPALEGMFVNTFYASNAQLEKVDMLGGGMIRAGNFRNYSALNLFVFRNTESITTLYDLNGIETTKFGSNGSGGTIYVPQALISSYQADSKWSTILGYTNNRILKIEGSEYELYYADGSLIETY